MSFLSFATERVTRTVDTIVWGFTMTNLLSSAEPWIESAVYEAILEAGRRGRNEALEGNATTGSSRFAQVISSVVVREPSDTLHLVLSDGSACISTVITTTASSNDTGRRASHWDRPLRGCIVRIKNWKVVPLQVLPEEYQGSQQWSALAPGGQTKPIDVKARTASFMSTATSWLLSPFYSNTLPTVVQTPGSKASTRRNESENKVIGLHIQNCLDEDSASLVVMGGIGSANVGNPIPVHSTISVRRALGSCPQFWHDEKQNDPAESSAVLTTTPITAMQSPFKRRISSPASDDEDVVETAADLLDPPTGNLSALLLSYCANPLDTYKGAQVQALWQQAAAVARDEHYGTEKDAASFGSPLRTPAGPSAADEHDQERMGSGFRVMPLNSLHNTASPAGAPPLDIPVRIVRNPSSLKRLFSTVLHDLEVAETVSPSKDVAAEEESASDDSEPHDETQMGIGHMLLSEDEADDPRAPTNINDIDVSGTSSNEDGEEDDEQSMNLLLSDSPPAHEQEKWVGDAVDVDYSRNPRDAGHQAESSQQAWSTQFSQSALAQQPQHEAGGRYGSKPPTDDRSRSEDDDEGAFFDTQQDESIGSKDVSSALVLLARNSGSRSSPRKVTFRIPFAAKWGKRTFDESSDAVLDSTSISDLVNSGILATPRKKHAPMLTIEKLWWQMLPERATGQSTGTTSDSARESSIVSVPSPFNPRGSAVFNESQLVGGDCVRGWFSEAH
jgi:hypothetical protein